MKNFLHKIFYLFLLCCLKLACPFTASAQASFGDATGGVGNLSSSNNLVTAAGTTISTGTIAPALPLLTLPGTTGRIDFGLRYTAGAGVRVTDVASEVGLGWILTGAGAITREVRGYPDDNEYGWIIDYGSMQDAIFIQGKMIPAHAPVSTAGNLVSYYKKIYRYNGSNGFRDYGANESGAADYFAAASQALRYDNYNWNTHTYSYGTPTSSGAIRDLDTQPDIYNVTLPTGGFQFVFDDNGNPVPIQAQNIRIEALNLGSRNSTQILHEFRITTSDGTQYLFGSPNGDNSYKESQTVTTTTLSNSSSVSPIPAKTDYSCITKWLLKKITYAEGEEINYQYRSSAVYEVSNYNYLQQDYLYTLYGRYKYSSRPYISFPAVVSTSAIQASIGWSRAYTVKTSIKSSDYKQLEKVSTAQGSITLTYDAAARLDIGGSTNALAGIVLRNKDNTLIKSLRFVHHYAGISEYGSTMPSDYYHLLLDKVIDQGAGCDFIKLYELSYNNTFLMRNTDGKDDWGYLNTGVIGNSATSVGSYNRSEPPLHQFSLSGRDRSPSLTYAQALILQSIRQATGGEMSFVYELHDASGNYQGVVGGLRIKTITQYDGITHDHDIVETFTYKEGGFSTGVLGDRGSYAKLGYMRGEASYPGTNSNKLTDEQIRGDLPVCVMTNNENNIKNSYYLLRSDASFYAYANDYINYRSVLIDHGSKGKSKYEFTSWNDEAHRDYADSDCRLQTALRYGQSAPCPNDPLQAGNRGRTIAIPFSLELSAINNPSTEFLGGGFTASFPRRTSRAGERGLLTKLTQLSVTDKPVAVTINDYDFAHTAVSLPAINALSAQPDMGVMGFTQYYNYFELYYYQIQPVWTPLVRTTQILYDQEAEGDIAKAQISTTQIDYSNFLPQKTSRYAGYYPGTGKTKYVTEVRYPQNFAGGDADQVTTPGLLRRAGMTGVAIEQEVYTDQPTSTCSKTARGATFTEYQRLNNRVLPYRTYTAHTGSACFTAATTDNSTGTWRVTKDASYQLEQELLGYTADNRPVNSLDRSGVPRATIWGYNHTLPIATVTNGQATIGLTGTGLVGNAAYTSLEEDYVDGDGWTMPSNFSTEAKTGGRSARIIVNQSYYAASRKLTLKAGANRHGKLIYSCWTKVPTGVTTAAGLYLAVGGQGRNNGTQNTYFVAQPGKDWQYVETVVDLDSYTWTNGLSTTDDLELFFYQDCHNGQELLVDEIRIHRADAQMQTIAYLPLVGKTDVTDPSGVTSYYKYDTNYRPHLTLNQNRDIVQRTQSKVVGQLARPSAAFRMPEFATQGCDVQLVADYTDCGSSTFTWDFGDGTRADNSGGSQTHRYSQPGTYTVSLLVTNPQLGASRLSNTITIYDPFELIINSSGNIYIDLCYNNNPDPIILKAELKNTNCQGPVTYQWQRLGSSNQWETFQNSSETSCPVYEGTQSFRCLVTTSAGDNSSSPYMQIIQITGYMSSTDCQIY